MEPERGSALMHDVYLYGMTVLSTIHRVESGDVLADGYGEIGETYVCPGGEAMHGALILSGLGLRTALGGPHWGSETHAPLARYAARHGIDVAGIHVDHAYPGVRDVVIVHGEQRSVLGWFGHFFSERPARWSEPDPTAIERARVVAIDPFFGASSTQAALLAQTYRKPYITIDCEHDSVLHAHAAATVVSREYRSRQYPGLDDEQTFARYTARSAKWPTNSARSHPWPAFSSGWRGPVPLLVPSPRGSPMVAMTPSSIRTALRRCGTSS